MIDYPRHQFFRVALSVRGTVVPRVAPRVLIVAVIALAACGWNALAPESLAFKPLAHSLVGIAMGMLLVFRTNASYDRWWEARKQWGGMVNASRNLVRIMTVHAGDGRRAAALCSAWSLALVHHLRGERHPEQTRELLGPEAAFRSYDQPNVPAAIGAELSRNIALALGQGRLAPDLARLAEGLVMELLDHQGACERILNTPLPFAYVTAVRQLLLVYLFSLPMVLVGELGWWSIPAAVFIAYGLLAIEEAGIEIEDPFGTDPNDLPLDAICATIAQDCAAMAAGPSSPAPRSAL